MNRRLCTKELEIIQDILSRYESVQSAILFGSSVTGNFKTASDVDIALKGAITIKLIAKIKAEFEDSNFPFFVDIVDYAKADNALKNEIDTQGVVLYPHFKSTTNTWKRVKLGEVGTIITGKTPSYNNPQDWGDSMLFITPTDYKHYHKYASDSARKISDAGLKRFAKIVLPKNSILVTCIGSDMGKVIINKSEAITNQQINSIIPNQKINYDFLYYSMVNMRPTLKIFGSDGTAVPILNKGDFENLTIPLPPLETQNQIASILSSFDDKIDLLHRQNKTLESLALTLFRHTFIDNPNRNEWEEIKLGDYVECVNGYSYKSSELSKSDIALVTLKNFARDGSCNLNGFKEFVGTKFKDSQIVRNGDLVVAHTDITQEAEIIGNPMLIIDIGKYKKLVITMDLVKVKPKTEWLSKEFLYYLFKTQDFKFYCLGNSNGTTVLHMNRKAIMEYTTKIPNPKVMMEFDKNISHLFGRTYNNLLQIQSLQQTRDLLLTKIFNG